MERQTSQQKNPRILATWTAIIGIPAIAAMALLQIGLNEGPQKVLFFTLAAMLGLIAIGAGAVFGRKHKKPSVNN